MATIASPRPIESQVSVIRKELVTLTQNSHIAVVLNQLLYWSQRVSDFEQFLEEEQYSDSCHRGWFYKSAYELTQETMLSVTRVTMRKYLNFLIEQGWLLERSNPQNKWDKTIQYRLNLSELQADLQTLGYTLPGFPKDLFLAHDQEFTMEGENSQNSNPSAVFETDPSEVSPSSLESRKSDYSNVKNSSLLYLTEITSKTTNKDHTQRVHENAFLMTELWKIHISPASLHLTPHRKLRLESLLKQYFQNDLSQWEAFCKRIKISTFMMGGGPQKWQVSFDWILKKKNILKVLEGNFDNPKEIQLKKDLAAKILREEKTLEILDSIEDPFWREWCSQLSEFPPHGYSPISYPLYWWQLERIAKAQFLEFDGRHVILGSSDQKVLNGIEEWRHPISSIVARNYPRSRSIRTRLIEEEEPHA